MLGFGTVRPNPDYSHACILWLFCSLLAWWRSKRMIAARTAPFPLEIITVFFLHSRDPKT
jgi:hypothetical protein